MCVVTILHVLLRATGNAIKIRKERERDREREGERENVLGAMGLNLALFY